ncbi:MAG: four helix bundle protein [Acidobacteria bacterium]|nr:four helix bundle protein [Acidobacteriota bacterium]
MAKEIDERLFRFACRAVDVFGLLNEAGGAGREIARQYLRAATAIGANAAEAAAGQSKADFVAKLAISRKECREVLFWLRLIDAKCLLPKGTVSADLDEARQLAAILSAIVRSAQSSARRGP